MARKVSKKDMESILMQAMMAAKNVRAQRDRLLELQRRLQSHQADAAPAPTPTPADSDATANDKLGELASDVFKVYYIGLEAGARMLTTCVYLAIQKGVRLAPPNRAFAVMNDEQLHDALLAQKLPARPTTQGQGLDRVMAAVMAVKLLEEHLLPRCVECLAGGRAPVPGMTPDSSPDSSPDRDHEPLAAAIEGLAKVDLSDEPDDTVTPKTGNKPRDAAGGGDVVKALDYLYRANRIASLAVKHLDLAVSVLSRFIDAKKLSGLTEFCNAHAYISEEGPAPTVESVTTSPDGSRLSTKRPKGVLSIADQAFNLCRLMISVQFGQIDLLLCSHLCFINSWTPWLSILISFIYPTSSMP